LFRDVTLNNAAIAMHQINERTRRKKIWRLTMSTQAGESQRGRCSFIKNGGRIISNIPDMPAEPVAR